MSKKKKSKSRSASRSADSKQATAGSSGTPAKRASSAVDVDAPDLAQTTNHSLSRYVSFGLLLGVIALVGFVFYEVMASFLVPLFLASLLVVVFRPLHRWILEKSGQREKIAALLTTASILLLVLIPISSLLIMAAMEGREVVSQSNPTKVIEGVRSLRSRLGLEIPAAEQFNRIEQRLEALERTAVFDAEGIDFHKSNLFEIEESAKQLAVALNRPWPDLPDLGTANEESKLEQQHPHDHWLSFVQNLQAARTVNQRVRPSVENETADESQERLKRSHQYQEFLSDTASGLVDFKSQLLGGRVKVWLAGLVNPTESELETYSATVIDYVRNTLFKVGSNAISAFGSTLLGFAIMVIGLYFFLLDGPKMLESFKGLSPLDDDHEQELVAEFGRVSRAVVVATLLAALVQGLLAGIGFYFCGLESIFLLTVLSGVLAMVPFVGAAAVWVPCCLYLYFFENNLTAAIGLAIYGTLIISMADNIIKPFVLHGQSNLHPLLALLSVLGGVATLGPIGILVGPMVVAFLQTLLKILQQEMTEIDMVESGG